MNFDWFRLRAESEPGIFLFDEPLSKHTYYRIGGPARVLAIPRTPEHLKMISEGLAATGVPLFFLGSGSNLLVGDGGFEGVVMKTGRVNLDIALTSGGRLRTGASVAVSSLLRRAAAEGWGGLEFLAGVPGSIGGVVTMNAGTHLGEAKDRLRRVEALRMGGANLTFEGSDLKFEYRKNHFLGERDLVTAAEWEITPGDPAKVKAAIDDTLARRKSTQPIDYPSCGSVFKNPRAHGMHAWQVIEKLGLRGHRIGGAEFSPKHCNFIVNLGGAKAADVRALIELAQRRAKDDLGIELEEEVKYLGSFA